MKIGLLGIGVIATAIVHGMCYENDFTHEIYLSPRNKANAEELSSLYKNVHVCKSNQEVVDCSEYVIFSVLPNLGEEIIRPLKFKSNQSIINLMSDKKLPEIKSWIGETKSLTHVVPLSFISKRSGPIAVYPQNTDVINLFKPLGDVIAVDEVSQIEAIAAITGLMTTYYSLLWDVAKWGEKFGLPINDGIDYTTSFFEALSKHSRESSLELLSKEMTPGGFNEMALNNIKDNSGLDLWVSSLDSIIKRLRN